MKIKTRSFGDTATLYSLENDNGYKLEVTDLGARIVNLFVPTESGSKNIVLGFDSEEEYRQIDPYIGATIARVAGRIRKGQFQIDGVDYQAQTQADQHGNTLHGGPHNVEEKIWQGEPVQAADRVQVIFRHTSADGAKGFPGELRMEVTYTLTNDNEWLISYRANTDKATLFNPTNHVYFNLTGDVTASTKDHTLRLAADKFAVVDDTTSATGELRDVTGTSFDFRQGRKLAQAYDSSYEQNTLVDGLDHPFVLNKTAGPAAVLTSPTGDIAVEMLTDEPSVVIFTAQFGSPVPMRGKTLAFHGGITLETQVLPGAVEFAGFGDIVLRPEDTFESTTIFKIITK